MNISDLMVAMTPVFAVAGVLALLGTLAALISMTREGAGSPARLSDTKSGGFGRPPKPAGTGLDLPVPLFKPATSTSVPSAGDGTAARPVGCGSTN